MKRFISILSLLAVFLTASAQRPKVGLVLCGGGAKGAAHIGVLKALEDNNIPIDYIAGTSMGAIVGGLYSIGYSADELDSLILAQDWNVIMKDKISRRQKDIDQKQFEDKYLLRIPLGKNGFSRLKSKSSSVLDNIPLAVVNGNNVYNLFTKLTLGYQDSLDFSRMPIPFACVAVDIAGKKEYVFHSGSIIEAMRASMAIPGYFDPVRKGDMVLCDGGLLNNYPVDVVKQMGADIVIGVKLGGFNPEPQDIGNIGDMVNEMMDLYMDTKLASAVENTDILITPDVTGYSALSFDTESLKNLIENGRQAAMEKGGALDSLRVSLRIEEEDFVGPTAKPEEKYRKAIYIGETDTVRIASVQVNGLDLSHMRQLLRHSKFQPGAALTGAMIERELDALYSTGAFDSVTYTLTGEEEPYHMTLNFEPGPKSQIGLGMRVDSEEIAAILLNVGINEKALYGHKLSLSAKLAYNLQLQACYNYAFKNVAHFEAGYKFRNSNLNILNIDANTSYAFRQHSLWMGFSNHNTKITKMDFGLKMDRFSSMSNIGTAQAIKTYDYSEARKLFLGGYFNFAIDRLDRSYFPTKGLSFQTDYTYYFNRLLDKEHNDFMSLHAKFLFVAPMGRRFALIGTLEGRTLIGNDTPAAFMNLMGGTQSSRYMDQQISFIGFNNARMFQSSLTTATVDLRYRLMDSHYFFASGAMAGDAQDISDIFNAPVFGARLGYSYDSLIGPVSANFSWSNIAGFGFYASIGYSF